MTLTPREDSPSLSMPRSDPPLDFGSAKLRRDPMRVVIRLMDGAHIEGVIHVQPYTRTLDLLNQREDAFIAVTEARLTEPGGATLELSFLAVNKTNIARVYETKNSES